MVLPALDQKNLFFNVFQISGYSNISNLNFTDQISETGISLKSEAPGGSIHKIEQNSIENEGSIGVGFQ
jgi:hypothetical protein